TAHLRRSKHTQRGSRHHKEYDGGHGNTADNREWNAPSRFLDLGGHDGHAHEAIPAPHEDSGTRKHRKYARTQRRREIRHLDFWNGEPDEYGEETELNEQSDDQHPGI